MRMQLARSCAWVLLLNAASFAAPSIKLELATERGVQITAPHEWLQLLASIGVDNVRIRGQQPGDELKAENVGSAERPSYHVLGFLTSGDQLRLPGSTFSRGDRAALKDYFERLGDDGAEALTAPRGWFGLMRKDWAAVSADLTQPIDFETKGQAPSAVMDRLQARFVNRLAIDSDAHRALSAAKPVADDLKGLTAGTGLAMMLRGFSLALRPENLRGQPVTHRVVLADMDQITDATISEIDDVNLKRWPIGWKPGGLAADIVPELFEPRNAEIEGYTLGETLSAIGSRVKVPFFVDHAALRAARIDPAAVQVRLARSRISYKRVLDRVLSQARLYCQIRVDEAGTPFVWITR